MFHQNAGGRALIHSKRWVVRHVAAGTLRPVPETPPRASRLRHLPDADVTVAFALNRGLYFRESEILDVVIDAVVRQPADSEVQPSPVEDGVGSRRASTSRRRGGRR